MPFALSADLEYAVSVLDHLRFNHMDQNPKGIRDLIGGAVSKAKQLEREEARLSEKLTELRLQYADLKAKYDKLSSDVGWKQSADWAQRSGGTL